MSKRKDKSAKTSQQSQAQSRAAAEWWSCLHPRTQLFLFQRAQAWIGEVDRLQRRAANA